MAKTSFEIKNVIPVENEGVVLYRIFNFSPTGYIIVTADDNAEPLIGYGLDSNFNFDDAPPALLYLLESYKNEMTTIIEKHLKADAKIIQKWNNYSSSEFSILKSYSPEDYLLETTWGQQNGYNNFCPIDPNSSVLCVAGCGPVALAQILHYWGCRVFPDNSNTYTPPNFISSLTVNFYNQNYNWDAMNHSTANNDNAELIYHCGVAMNAQYSSSSTGVYISNAETALENYFGFYTDGLKVKDNFTLSEWIDMLKTDIDNGRPIYYRGGGHAWVVDGYNYSDEFHCNWGWYGQYIQNWYTLSSLNPGEYNLNTDQKAIIGAVPILDACSGLTGAEEVCSSSNESYSVSIPSTASVVWSRSGAVSQVGVNTNPTYTVSYGYNGEGTVTATIKNSQGQTFLTRSKDVWAGEPHDLELYCEGRGMLYTYAFYVTPFYDSDSIVWGVYPPPAELTDLGYGYATIRFDGPGIYDIWAYVANECGDGTYAYITDFYVYELLMSPNPASTEVEITISAGLEEGMKSASLSSGDEYLVTILDNYGVAKIQNKYYGKKFTVPVSSLKDGNYFVKVSNEKLNATKQLIIKR